MTEPSTEPSDSDSDLSYIEHLALADPDTTLGKLQRGRGAGWLECLELPREEAHDLLWQCIVFDSRIDQQIERREDYYVSLARLTGFDVNRLRPHELPPAEEWRDRRLLFSVLSDLDIAGVPGAGSALLGHLGAEDDSRDFVLPEVLRASAATISELPEALSSRRTDEQLEATVYRWLEDFPWETWAKTNGRIAAALGQAQESSEQEQTRPRSHPHRPTRQSRSSSAMVGKRFPTKCSSAQIRCDRTSVAC